MFITLFKLNVFLKISYCKALKNSKIFKKQKKEIKE